MHLQHHQPTNSIRNAHPVLPPQDESSADSPLTFLDSDVKNITTTTTTTTTTTPPLPNLQVLLIHVYTNSSWATASIPSSPAHRRNPLSQRGEAKKLHYTSPSTYATQPNSPHSLISRPRIPLQDEAPPFPRSGQAAQHSNRKLKRRPGQKSHITTQDNKAKQKKDHWQEIEQSNIPHAPPTHR